MSLVGPRPPIPYEVENYDVWHRRRLLEAKPGITGSWQVSGRSRVTFDEMVRLDLRYARPVPLGWTSRFCCAHLLPSCLVKARTNFISTYFLPSTIPRPRRSPHGYLRNATRQSSVTPKSADVKSLRFGVIGYGYWGPNVVRNLDQLEEVDVMGVCDLNASARQRVQKAFPHLAVTSDPTELLSSHRRRCHRGGDAGLDALRPRQSGT